jgi:hypothetical protein
MGAGDLLVRRAGALAGLFDRLLFSFASVGCASTAFEGLLGRVWRASMGAGDLLTRRAGAFAGLSLRERTGLLIEDARSRLAGLLAGLFDLEAARLEGLVTRPATTRAALCSRNSLMYSSRSFRYCSKSFVGLFDLDTARRPDGLVTRPAATRFALSSRNFLMNSSVPTISGSKSAGYCLGPTASCKRIIGNESRGTSPSWLVPARLKPLRMALKKADLLTPFFRHSSSPSPTRLRSSFLTLR